ncbi:MAG: arsenite methyltransferase [Ignavibacteriaceae bacterium]
MVDGNKLKEMVKDKYAEIAVASNRKSCCGSGEESGYEILKDEYSGLDGYVKEADLKLGCGIPTELAQIKFGDTVVDLGSGAGNDVFIARAITGEQGKVIGLDFTEEMIKKAIKNNAKLGYHNIEFKLGEIENMPLDNEIADVVISNCVLNLVPDKKKAFSEIHRILKPGAHFCVSDIVIKGNMNEEFKKSASLYAGCVSGAIDQDEYLNIIKDTGFKDIEIKRIQSIPLPDSLLEKHFSSEEILSFSNNVQGMFSITVSAKK